MRVCPNCSSHYDDKAQVCDQCGARLMLDTASMQGDPLLALIGKVIGGNYRVEALVGKGGMGAVYRARQLSLDREVAIKVLIGPLAMDTELLERFQREARAASNIGHPGIIQVIDLGYLDQGAPFIAMELLAGEDLRAKLTRERALRTEEAILLVLQVLDALGAAHDKGIVHRDLKPENIFLVYRQGRFPMIKLLDFGLSKIKGADRKLTGTGALLGTPHYMSPEQVRGDSKVDHRSDVYAAGVILYEMLTGKPAYDGPSVQSILVSISTEDPKPPRLLRPDIPESVQQVILRAIARDPGQRYQSLSEMAADLGMAGSRLGVQAQMASVVSALPGMPVSTPLPTAYGSRNGMSTIRTPPPVAMSGIPSHVQGAGHLASRTLLAGIVGLGALFAGAAILVVVASVVVMVVSRMTANDDQQASAFIPDDGAFQRSGEKEPPLDPARHGSQFGIDLGTGFSPRLCCSAKNCSVVYVVDKGDHQRVMLRRIGADLYPVGDPVSVSPEGRSSSWPSCFPGDGGAMLVIWQQGLNPFSSSPGAMIHRVVVGENGTVGEVQSSRIQNTMVMDEIEPCYTASPAGDRVVLAWNHMKGVDMSQRMMVMGMDGGALVPEVVINPVQHVHQPSIACKPGRCILTWTRPTLPMNHVQKLTVLDDSGKVEKKEITIFDRGVMIRQRVLLPVKGGVALVWVEQDDDGDTHQMLARYDWNGEETLAPMMVDEFERGFEEKEASSFVSSDPDQPPISMCRVQKDKTDGIDEALCLVIDESGKVTEMSTVSHAEESIEETSVFYDASGNPIIVFVVGTFSDERHMWVTRFTPR